MASGRRVFLLGKPFPQQRDSSKWPRSRPWPVRGPTLSLPISFVAGSGNSLPNCLWPKSLSVHVGVGCAVTAHSACAFYWCLAPGLVEANDCLKGNSEAELLGVKFTRTPKPLNWHHRRSRLGSGRIDARASIDSEFPTPYVVHTRVIWWKIVLSSVIRLVRRPWLLPVDITYSFRGHLEMQLGLAPATAITSHSKSHVLPL